MRRSSQVISSSQENTAFEMEERVNRQDQRPASSQMSMASLTSVVRAATQWTAYTRSRWRKRLHSGRKPAEQSMDHKYQGLAQDDAPDVPDGAIKNYQLNKKLLDHFRALAVSNQDTDEVDLQYLNDVIASGADANSADKYGQTALHEISRVWNVDVMRFFLERGADLHQADSFGVTPLHVAAALDYGEMVHFLLQRQANMEGRTQLDRQTPLHYAAKNDAVGAVKLLLRHGADISARDYKQRTPLQLAANLDRSEAARALMDFGADAGVQDSDGQLCITAMIGQMAPVAQLALNQFHVKDRMTRRQFYYLNLLEPEPPCQQNFNNTAATGERVSSEPTSPLEFIVQQGKLELVMHPVVLKLITVKWNLYGRTGAWILLLLNFFFIISWTTVAISVSVIREEDEPYVFPQDWWRVLVMVLALVLTLVEVCREAVEMVQSNRKLHRWQTWFQRRVQEDLRCSHPMWPEERKFLEGQLKFVRRTKASYFRDLWNVFDWLVYLLLAVVFCIHVADIFVIESTLRSISLRLFAVTVIFLWLRLMKHVRAFRVMGPFIVMLGNIAGDVLRFLFLYAEFYIPYACAFWIIFGGKVSVPSMQTVPQLLYSLYRITLVDDYEFDAMLEVDSVMAYLLCGTFLALSAVLCVNLLIALLSDTFQRVYENALANAVMQQAAIILQVEESMPHLRRHCDKNYIHQHCAPLGEFYDEDVPTDPDQHSGMAEITSSIKETLDGFLEINKVKHPLDSAKQGGSSRGSGAGKASLLDQEECLRSLQHLQKDHSRDLNALKDDVKELRALLQTLIQSGPCLREGRDPAQDF